MSTAWIYCSAIVNFVRKKNPLRVASVQVVSEDRLRQQKIEQSSRKRRSVETKILIHKST
eukprot:c48986_g1_i1 orf=99-278(+)